MLKTYTNIIQGIKKFVKTYTFTLETYTFCHNVITRLNLAGIILDHIEFTKMAV